MFIVISRHWCKEGQIDAARERMEKNVAGMAGEPGFVYRYRLESPAQPDVLVALTAWNEEADYQRYRGKRFGGGHDLSATPYVKVEAETFEVKAFAGSAPA